MSFALPKYGYAAIPGQAARAKRKTEFMKSGTHNKQKLGKATDKVRGAARRATAAIWSADAACQQAHKPVVDAPGVVSAAPPVWTRYIDSRLKQFSLR